MSEQLTLGVIGHVDHGKTALVRALTGIETDRLKEEQERGLSIVLGFSYIETDAGMIDLIDVPGHEDFIRTMISGATGIDGILLVIAANEGIMPQTQEHFDIARLLDLQFGLIVITKVDLVSEYELAVVEENIRRFLRGSFLEDAPLIATSAVQSSGMDVLQRGLEQLARRPVSRSRGPGSYLPIDRVFSMAGFGTVVTGTLRGGALRTDDRLEIQPGNRTAAVRQLQTHRQVISEAVPGQRVAVNLRNIGKAQLRRGDTLCAPGVIQATRLLDAELKLLEGAGQTLKNSASVRVLFGTTEAVAKLRLLERQFLHPGEAGLVQLRCQRDVATAAGEHFIIRSYSPMRTIGGGRILDANPDRHRRFDEAVAGRLSVAASGTPRELLETRLAAAGLQGLEIASLTGLLDTGVEELEASFGELPIVRIGGALAVHKPRYVNLLREILDSLRQYHESQPTKPGLRPAMLQKELAEDLSDEVFEHALDKLQSDAQIEQGKGLLRLAGFDPRTRLDPESYAIAEEIENAFLTSGLAPPRLQDVVDGDRTKQELYRLLVDTGQLVLLRGGDRERMMIFHQATLDEAQARLQQEFPPPRSFTLSEARTLLDSTRKYVVPLMEHFDATGITVRNGDKRQMRRR